LARQNGVLSQELEPVVDLGPVQWVRDALPEFGLFLPPDYDAYVAILHPFRRAVRSPGTLSGFAIVWLSWHEVSASLGVPFETNTDWESIDGFGSPQEGALEDAQLAALLPLLTSHTRTPDTCWFAVWEGRTDLDRGVDMSTWPHTQPPPGFDLDGRPQLQLPCRSYYVVRGAVRAAAHVSATDVFNETAPDGGEGVDLWWPDDRSWFVATDIDFSLTYVCGSDALIEAILEDSRLEAIRVDATGAS
jgi:hypothetical protein